MFDTVSRLYRSGQISESGVWEAVRRGWITRRQAEAILSCGNEGPAS